ncbi:MAG: YegS/Rv2252/BmrU family lipid kinase [Bacteroidales bacterium]|jgi:YegS/Rv2252/BmrU family lipid kinase|nr:YegS/Rv2252/BmrU family lipid kinase [Bacteroidales bacterium]
MVENYIDSKSNHWCVIINPNALAGKSEKLWKDFSLILEKNEIHFTPYIANKENAGKEIANSLCLQGFRHFMVFGGDGTVNEIVNGICSSAIDTKEVFLVSVPVGTGNDWARTHQYSNKFDKWISDFTKGNFISHDVGMVESVSENTVIDKRHFINIAGFGFDAAVINVMKGNKYKYFTGAVYVLSILKALFSHKAQQMEFAATNFDIKSNVFSIAVGLCKYNGNGMKQVPAANPFDGIFDVVVIRKINKLKIIANMANLFSGKHLKLREIDVYQTDKLDIIATEPVLGEVEGEMLKQGNYSISLLPQHINVLKVADFVN